MPRGDFNPEMLRLARDARAMSQSALAQASGLTQAFISKLEHGLNACPSEESISKIASAVRFPPAFFFQKAGLVGLPHFHFRKRSRLGAKALARIAAWMNIRRMHIETLLRSYEIAPQKPVPQIDLAETGHTPEKAAELTRAYWLLPRGPIQNLTEILELAGAMVITEDFGTRLLDGLSFRAEGLPPLFFMNKEAPGDRFRFSLAHELGHMVMHGSSHLEDDDKMEEEANRFAAAFLTPASDIRPYIINANFNKLGRVKAYWRVSIKSLIRRMSDLKLITSYQYKSMNIEYNKVFKLGEPVSVNVEKPRLPQRIINYHLQKLSYSMAELLVILRADRQDIEQAYLKEERPIRLVV